MLYLIFKKEQESHSTNDFKLWTNLYLLKDQDSWDGLFLIHFLVNQEIGSIPLSEMRKNWEMNMLLSEFARLTASLLNTP